VRVCVGVDMCGDVCRSLSLGGLCLCVCRCVYVWV